MTAAAAAETPETMAPIPVASIALEIANPAALAVAATPSNVPFSVPITLRNFESSASIRTNAFAASIALLPAIYAAPGSCPESHWISPGLNHCCVS